jgi:hypothetical protein
MYSVFCSGHHDFRPSRDGEGRTLGRDDLSVERGGAEGAALPTF